MHSSVLTLLIRDFSNDVGLSTTWNTGGEEPMTCHRHSRRRIPVTSKATCLKIRPLSHVVAAFFSYKECTSQNFNQH